MRTDADLTRLVEDWLAEEARPLPDHVRDAVLDALPTTTQRHHAITVPVSWLHPLRFAAVAALTLALVVATPAIVDLMGRYGRPATSAGPLGSPAHPCTAAMFEDARTIDTARSGNGPMDVVAADFNGDGKPDFAVANESSGDATIGVLLGRGNGTFGEPVGFPSGGAFSLAAVDANRDGRVDLVGVATSRDRLVVLLGDGLGGFRPPQETEVGSRPVALTVGDFNDDAISDLAVALAGERSIVVLGGNGNGSFSETGRLDADGVPSSVAIADFNGDGSADLAVALSEENHLEVFLGTGHGGFGVGRDVASRASFTVTAGDVNGDGHPDLVTGNHGENGVGVLLGDGLGGFGPVDFVGVGGDRGVGPVVLGRFGGTGQVDVAAAADGRDSAVIALRGDGAGGFTIAAIIPVGSGPLGIAAADFDGDGAIDLVTSDVNESAVSLLPGTCAGR